MSETLKAHLALLGAAIIYGANYVVAKSVMPDPINANGFIVMRVVGAGLLFWLLRFWVREKIERRDWLRLAICGVTGVAVNQLMFFNGLQITSPINAAIIMTSNPILVMVMASLLLKNAITGRKIIGVLAGALGAVGIIYLSAGSTNSIASVKGDTFILINSISYAIYLVLVKPLMSRYKAITVISWVFFFGFCVVMPVGIEDFSEIAWPTFTSWQIFAALFVVLGTTFLTYLFNIYALQRVQPTVASSYIYFQPLLAGLFSWLFSLVSHHNYAADFSWLKVLCALSIVFGVWMVSRKAAT